MPVPASSRTGAHEPVPEEVWTLSRAVISILVACNSSDTDVPKCCAQAQAMRHFQGNAMQHIRDKLQNLRMDANARSALERRVKGYLVEQQGMQAPMTLRVSPPGLLW